MSAQVHREIGRDLRSASDEQLSRVVAIVDSMPARGAADELLDLVRPRLAAIRPERPLTFSRVLFSPLDPAIVQSRDWRPGTASIPRSALALVGRELVDLLGGLASDLNPLGAMGWCGDRKNLVRIGGRLWPAAAEAVASMQQPRLWRAETGLSDGIWADIRDALALMLSVAIRMESLLECQADDAEFRRLLADHLSCRESALAILLRVLLIRHHHPAAVIRAVAALREPRAVRAKDLAVASIFADTPATLKTIVAANAGAAADEAIQLASVLDALDATDNQEPVRKLRAKALDACQQRLERCLEQDMIELLKAPTSDLDKCLSSAENGARDASRLERAARALGGQPQAQRALQWASERILGIPSERIDPVDRARLIEILLGPEAAILAETPHSDGPATCLGDDDAGSGASRA